MSKIVIKSKTQQVYEELQDAIIRNELSPNTPLVIDKVAKELGVSHIPVREALQQLETEGFVVSEPYAGSMVSDIKPVFIYEIFKTLETLEITSAQMASHSVTQDQLEGLRNILIEMDSVLENANQWSALNVEFHKKISSSSDSMLAQTLLELMLKHWDRFRRYYFKDVFAYRIEKAQKEHWRMFEALENRDPQQIAEVITEHNQASLVAYLRFLKDNPGSGPLIMHIADIVEQEYTQ